MSIIHTIKKIGKEYGKNLECHTERGKTLKGLIQIKNVLEFDIANNNELAMINQIQKHGRFINYSKKECYFTKN